MVPSKTRQRFSEARSRGVSSFQAALMSDTSCRWNSSRTSALVVACSRADLIGVPEGEKGAGVVMNSRGYGGVVPNGAGGEQVTESVLTVNLADSAWRQQQNGFGIVASQRERGGGVELFEEVLGD
jgi:hypothetical protein